MFAFLFIFLSFTCSGLAENLMNSGQVEEVFKNFLRNKTLSHPEAKIQTDVFEILRRPKYITLDDEPSTGARASLDCLLCRSAFAALIDLVADGASDESLAAALSTLCYLLGIESQNVCKGAVGLNLHIINYIIKNTPEVNSRSFCGLVLQRADNPTFCTYSDPRFEWQVELPEQTNGFTPEYVTLPPLSIVILTDAHVDPLYEPFGVGDCDEPVCCRKGQKLASPVNFISDGSEIEKSFITTNNDIYLNLDVADVIRERRRKTHSQAKSTKETKPAGYWGDYRNCDTPRWAFEDVIHKIKESHKFDVVYYLGDTIDHGVWETSYELVNAENAYLIGMMRNIFGNDVQIVPAIGNHESQPTNQFAPPSVVEPKLNTTWLYEALARKWNNYLPEEAKQSLRVGGDFSMQVRPGLRVISLNSNAAYKYNWWLVYDPMESKQHLDWLVQELHKAELAGEKVHILTHIPPGVSDFTYVWTREYARIVDRFSSTIAAEFNGHTHSDEFKIFYSLRNDTAINVAWGAGSATAFSNYNSNYKIATFDNVTFAPQNIQTYVYNLTEANLTPHRRPHWFQLYDMRNTFRLSDLTASSIDDLVHRMVSQDRSLLDLYSAFTTKLSDTRWPTCDAECKLNNLCRTVTTVLWRSEKCQELIAEYNSMRHD